MWLCAAGAFVGPVCAQQSDPGVRGVERVNISTGGIGVYRPEKWGAVKISLRNPQDREVHLLATTHFQGDPTLQYGRRFWMPAQSRMVIWHPLRMPAVAAAQSSGDPDDKFFELQSQVMSTEGGTETLAISDQGALHFDQSLRIASDSPTTAVIGEPGAGESNGSAVANAYDLLLTARYERGMIRNLTVLGDEQAPAGEEVLGALDQLVVFDDRLLNDLAGISSIRRWVTGGGQLWIMADQIRPELLAALLEDQSSLEVVGTAELTHLNVVPATKTGTAPFERDLDNPVSMVRVIGDGFTPAFVCDGWPVALWKSYGSGRILVTTLGPDGWVRPRMDSDPQPESGTSFKTRFFPGQPLVSLAAEFFVRQPAPALPPAVSEQTVQGMIGYRIPSRGLVVGSLMAFTGLIVGAGLWLSRRGHLERLGLAIPICSLLIASVLLGAGMKTRSEIPSSVAAVQMVQAVPGTQDVRLTGSAGVFTRDESSSSPLAGISGGWGLPDMTGLEGTTRRLVWNDLDHWSWEKLTRKPGLRTIAFQAAGQVERPLKATGSFSGGKLSGRLQLPEGMPASDAILATSSGRIGLKIESDGQWSIAQEQLGANQYLTATVLSDEQQRRTQLMSQILAPIAGQSPVHEPTLYAWTQPWTSALNLPEQAPIGSAVVAVPIEWQPMPSGTQFTLPRALLTMREIAGPDGSRPTGFFDGRSQQWVEKSGQNSGWLAFDIPVELLPLQTRKVEVTFKVTGPMGRLELSGFRNGKLESIRVWENPVGTIQHTVDDGSLMPIDSQGRMFFRVDAGVEISEIPEEGVQGTKDSTSSPMTYWQFEDVSVLITVDVPASDGATALTP